MCRCSKNNEEAESAVPVITGGEARESIVAVSVYVWGNDGERESSASAVQWDSALVHKHFLPGRGTNSYHCKICIISYTLVLNIYSYVPVKFELSLLAQPED